MITHLSPQLALILLAFTASGYAVATVGMKWARIGPTPIAFAVIAVGLTAAVVAEVVLLRHANLSVIYIGIIAAESLMVLTYAAYTGGALTFPQSFGALLVLGGFALVTLAD
jgi:hypothetical protein